MPEHALTLRYPPATLVHIVGSDPSALAWLREFVVPDFDEHPAGSSGTDVTLRLDALNGQAGTGPGTRVALLRAVRDIASTNVSAADGLIVHGAAVAIDGRGYIIAGPKEAGKTTLLLHLLLTTTGARYIANDRVALRLGAEQVTVRGMPTIVRVRGSSLRWFPALEERFQRSGFHHRHTLDEAARRPDPPLDDGSFDLTPAQFAHLLGVERSGEVPLAGLIFPKRTDSSGAASLTRLDRTLAAARLRASLLQSDTPRLDELLTRVGAYDCALGPDAYHSPLRLSL